LNNNVSLLDANLLLVLLLSSILEDMMDVLLNEKWEEEPTQQMMKDNFNCVSQPNQISLFFSSV
jgi:hypothetical protein